MRSVIINSHVAVSSVSVGWDFQGKCVLLSYRFCWIKSNKVLYIYIRFISCINTVVISPTDMAQEGKTITGMSSGTAVGANIVGQHNGPQHQHHIRDQRVQAGNIGALATGDNHQGPMTANMGQQRTEAWDPMTATSAVVQNLLRQEECDDNTIAIFKKKRINGRMLLKLSQEDLNQYGLTDEDEKKRVLNIIQDVQDGKLKLN